MLSDPRLAPSRHALRTVMPAVVLVLVLAACSAAEGPRGADTFAAATPAASASAVVSATDGAEAGAGRSTPAPTATPAPAPAPTPTPTPPPISGPVTIAFGGDVHFEGQLDAQVRSDATGMLDEIQPVLSAADIAVVNLETAVTEGGEPSPKQYNFAAPPAAFTALDAAGVDVVSLANNHGMDFGTTGLLDTLDSAAAADMPLIGAGRDDAEAYAPWTTTVNGREVAVIGATQVLDSFAVEGWLAGSDRPGLASAKENGLDRLHAAVEAAENTVDTVVVYLHWGREGDTCPLPRQQQLARTLVDAGADVVVGGHAHRLAGAGFMDDAYIAYGLGNFVFYANSGPGTDSGVLTVRVDADGSLHPGWQPARIRGGVPVPLSGAEAESALAAWSSLRGCTGLSAEPASG